MPTYTNPTANSRVIDNGIELMAGETGTYAKYYPAISAWLDSHEPYAKPWALLATVTSVPSSDINVENWDNVVIYNASDAAVSVSANGNDSDFFYIMPSSKEVWDNSNNLFSIITVLTNSGSGNVYVWGSA